MGVFMADNCLDLDISTLANYRAALTNKGYSYYAPAATQDATQVPTIEKLSVDGENRDWFVLNQTYPPNNTSKINCAIGFPIPGNDKPYYMAIRLYLGSLPKGATTVYPFFLATRTTLGSGTYPVYLDGNHQLHVGQQGVTVAATGVYAGYDDTKSFLFEFFHGADGSFKTWVDEIPVPANNMATLLRPVDGFVYIGNYQNGQQAVSGKMYFNDVIIIDPSTPGLQYRPGKTARVETMALTADITKDWTADASQPTHYGVMNLPFKASTPATEMLSAYSVGATERYQAGALRSDLGNLVHAVMVESQASNTAGAAHTLDIKAAFAGAAELTLATLTYTAGSGNIYNRMVMDKNPNDNADWTRATATAPKIAYSIKA